MKPGEVRRSLAEGEVVAHDVACSVFLARHSAYLDDDLLPRERSAHERHQAECASCARYARVLASGVDVLRSLPELEPSADFEARLQHRLFHLQDEAALRERGRSSRVWLAAAAALALLVVGERVLDERTRDAGSYASQSAPSARYDVAGWSAGWNAPAPPVIASTPVLLHSAAYSPVIVQPPKFRLVTATATD